MCNVVLFLKSAKNCRSYDLSKIAKIREWYFDSFVASLQPKRIDGGF